MGTNFRKRYSAQFKLIETNPPDKGYQLYKYYQIELTRPHWGYMVRNLACGKMIRVYKNKELLDEAWLLVDELP